MQKGKTWQRVASESYGDSPDFLMMKRKKTESGML